MRSEDHAGWREFTCLTFIVTILIVYGSLYPFDFVDRDMTKGIFDHLIDSMHRRPSRGDLIANVLLYLPLGFFGFLAQPPRLAGVVRWLYITTLGMALSVGIEFAQIWEPSRVSSLLDVIYNSTGTAIGAGAGWFIGRDLGFHRLGLASLRPTPIFLLAAWAGYRFAPFVPALDFQQIKNALKPLLLSPAFPPLQIAHHAIHWLAIASLIDALIERRRAIIVIILVAVVSNGLNLLIAGKEITAAATTGLAIGLILWFALIQRLRWRTGLTAGLFFALYLAEGLSPFEIQPVQADFHWDPFFGFLNNSFLFGVQTFLDKTFTYGTMLWLLIACRLRLANAMLVVVSLVSAVEWIQTWLPGRTAEITDPLMVILAGVVIGLVEARALQEDNKTAR